MRALHFGVGRRAFAFDGFGVGCVRWAFDALFVRLMRRVWFGHSRRAFDALRACGRCALRLGIW